MEKDEATRKFNLSLPAGLLDELYRAVGAEKRGRKQQVLTAAVVMFLESGPTARDEAMKRIGAAGSTKTGMSKLVNEVKAKVRRAQRCRSSRLPGAVRTDEGPSYQAAAAPLGTVLE